MDSNNISLKKLPPQNIEAEEMVLSAIMFDPETIHDALDYLLPEDFYRSAHQKIFAAIIDLAQKSLPYDLPSLFVYMKETGKLEEVGGGVFLSKLSDMPISVNVSEHAKIIKEKSALREMISKSNEVITRCYTGLDTVENILPDAQQALQNVFVAKKQGFDEKYNNIKNWIKSSPGEFTVIQVDIDHGFKTSREKYERTVILEKLVKDGVLERPNKKRGYYRPAVKDLQQMDFCNANDEPLNIIFPFEIHNVVKTLPGNIIQINGEKNSGKTAFLLNIIRYNMRNWNVHYFNSEMGAGELKMRLSLFDNPSSVQDWNFNAYERSGDFSDVIFPGPGNINIIDFLELHDEFYKMGQFMRDIHDKLKGAIAIVAVQKNQGNEFGLGGGRTEEKPRLILNITPGKIKIKMAKNWKAKENPNGKCLDFKLANGCRFVQDCDDWYLER